MKVIFFILLLITFNLRNYSQTKEKSDIFTFSASEDKFLRIDRIKQFQRENPFNLNAIEFICDYYKYKKVDSISIFFDDLAKKYPDSVKPWILRTEKLFYEIDYRNDSLYQSKKLEYLKKAYAINRNSFDVNYKLAKLFYDDFIDPYEKIFIKETKVIDREKNDSSYTQIDTLKMKDKSIFNHPEDSALFYFHNLENLSEQYKHFLYFPIKQIDTYKNISSDCKSSAKCLPVND